MAEEAHTQEEQFNDQLFAELSGEAIPKQEEPQKVEKTPSEEATPEPEIATEEVPQEPEKPVEEAAPETKEFNIKDYFPEYDDIETVKSQLERARSLPGEEEILTLKEKAELLDKYEKSFRSLKESGLSPELIRLQMAEKEDPEKAALYKRLLYGEPTDLEMIKLDLINKDPELKDDSEMLDYQLEKKFPEIYGDDADPESEEYQKALKGMKFEAMKARKRMKGEFESMEVPEYPDPAKAEEKVMEVVKTWQPHFEGHKDEIMTVSVDLPNEKGTEKLIDIKIPENKIKEYTQAAVQFIASQKLSYSKASLQKVKDVVKGMYLGKNLLAYNKAIFAEAEKRATESFRKSTHNPKEADVKAKQTKESTDEAFWNSLD